LPDRESFSGPATLLGSYLIASVVVVMARGVGPSFTVTSALLLIGTALFALRLRPLTPCGRVLVGLQLQLGAVATVWGLLFVWNLDVSTTTRVLMLSGLPIFLVTLPFGVLAMVPQWEVLARVYWRRPDAALPKSKRSAYPKVSLQVPICSEPPHVVLATLESLAALDYPNFEVLVIDNNTKDDSLWQPVERWCAGDARFRFFHLGDCPGAKAGALNFARTQVAPDAVIIGLIDSDYQAKPTFLSALAGYFDNPRIGFVQSPHDYRDWQDSLYQRMCYWEYRSFFTISVPSWNERGAAITVGTMSLIRKAALEEAGGWSEWCLTEDSELAPRIHALGYTSVYVRESFGYGLIPERFIGYAKQRRRWTYGPIQELRQHLKMFLPKPFAATTKLTAGQKLFHLHHDLDPLFTGIGLLLMPIGLAAITSMLVQGERPSVPWLAIVAGLFAGTASQIMSWTVQRRAMRCSLVDILCAGVAKGALAHCIAISALRALFGYPLTWQRTDKFKARSEGVQRALDEARVELMFAVALFTVGVLGLAAGTRGLLLLFFIGLLTQGIGYLMAPALAILADRELRRNAILVQTGATNAETV
jgi:cellulose synthase/poly-beta-1,6-N-acetylglucosamine synthase-like glycosyltransferase